jgi:hypothetical protein
VKKFEDMEYFPIVDKLSEILMAKTRSSDPLFFRVMVSYYLAKVASMMRANIKTVDRGLIPINLYALNLAPSGHGKNFSTNIVERDIIGEFKDAFLEITYPILADKNIEILALKRSGKNGSDPNDEKDLAMTEFAKLGPLLFSFDSGTTPALKQMRHKLLMSGAGSLNLEIDEFGNNMLGNAEILATYLELFDVGLVKTKLIKNTLENTRNEEIFGSTPTNMMLFGTPSKLLNGGKVEEEFYSMLETGYARRCLFGYNKNAKRMNKPTPQEVYDGMVNKTSERYITNISTHLGDLADIKNFNKELEVKKPVALLFIEYRLRCEEIAESYSEHKEIQKAEMSHRYFKALKLAGTYAFISGDSIIQEKYVYNAIKLVEDSGKAFLEILNRDKPYVKLAKYLASLEGEVTIADIMSDLPFFKGSDGARKDMLKTATAWGYTHNIIVKSEEIDEVVFYSGDALKETNLDELILSYSSDITRGYKNETASWDELYKLVTADNIHWVSCHLNEE